MSLVLLLLTAAAVAIVSSQREREARENPPLLQNLMPLFREAEFVRTTRVTSLGARRGRALCEEPDPRDFERATGVATFPDGDPPYAWFVGRRAGFHLDVLERVDRTLTLRISRGLPGDDERGVRVLFNGSELGRAELRKDSELKSVSVAVPAALQRRGQNLVELVFDRTDARELLGRPVELPLAAVVTIVSFLAEGESTQPTTRPPVWGLRQVGEQRKAELVVPARSCARLALALPDEDRLVLQLGLRRQPVPLLLTLQEDSGRRHSLAALDPQDGSRQLMFDLGRWRGEHVVVELWAQGEEGEAVFSAVQLRGGDGEPPASRPAPTGTSSERRPSFVIVLLDALARSRVGAYVGASPEDSLTPRLDALAEQGLVVERAQAPASYTLASTASLLTGQPPLVHGVYQLRNAAGYQRLADDTPRLARSLADAGWRTGALVTNPNAGARHGHAEGFETYAELDRDPSLWDDGVAGEHVVSRFAELLDDFGEDPFLAYVHVFEPHAPYDAPADLRARHVAPYDGPVRGDREWLDAFKAGRERPDAEGWRHLRELYAARVAQADRVLGQLLDELEASGRAEDTVVLVTSDHGEAFGEHRWIEHGDLTYGEEIDVPLVLAGPGVDAGRLGGSASLVDVAPTVLGLAGVSVPPAMRGVDLLRAPPGERDLEARSSALLPVLALTRWPWRLHLNTATREVSLHDLSRDPGEIADLSLQRPATALLLRQELTRRVLDARGRAAAARVEETDPDQLRMLEQLGYVGEDAPDGEDPLETMSLVLRELLTRL